MSKELFKMGVEEVEKIELYLSEFINLLHSHGYYNDLSREVIYEDKDEDEDEDEECLIEPKPIGVKVEWSGSGKDTIELSDGSFLEIETRIKKTKTEPFK